LTGKEDDWVITFAGKTRQTRYSGKFFPRPTDWQSEYFREFARSCRAIRERIRSRLKSRKAFTRVRPANYNAIRGTRSDSHQRL